MQVARWVGLWLISDVRQRTLTLPMKAYLARCIQSGLLTLVAVLFIGCVARPQFLAGNNSTPRSPKVEVEVEEQDSAVDRHATVPASLSALTYFPFSMCRAGVTGEVWAKVFIAADGKVLRTEVVKASQSEFIKPVTDSLTSARFFPAIHACVPHASWLMMRFKFILEEE